MSSEGDRYPVEPKIVPLVFALQELRVYPPCWSCEGHLRGDGDVFRLPQVWFYARSLIYVRLLAEWLRALRRDDRIANAWQITVSYSESGLDTAFNLEPDLKGTPRVDLFALQSDALTMADRVGPDIRQSARRYLDRHASPLAGRDGAASAPRRGARPLTPRS